MLLTEKQAAWLLNYIEEGISNSLFGDNEAVYKEWELMASQIKNDITPNSFRQTRLIARRLKEYVSFAKENEDIFDQEDIETAENVLQWYEARIWR